MPERVVQLIGRAVAERSRLTHPLAGRSVGACKVQREPVRPTPRRSEGGCESLGRHQPSHPCCFDTPPTRSRDRVVEGEEREVIVPPRLRLIWRKMRATTGDNPLSANNLT